MQTQHPRLFFTREDLPRIRASQYAADDLLAPQEHRITYFGNKEVVFPIPPVQPGKIDEPPGFDHQAYGHYPYWTAYAGRLRNDLYLLALSYAGTGRPEFADRARDYCLALIDWSLWTDPDYHPNLTPCLDTGHLTLGSAVAYDVCYNRLTPEERERIRDGVCRLGLRPIFDWVTRPAQQESEFNLEILLNAALGIGALSFLGEMDDAEAWQYIDQAKGYFMRLAEKKLHSPNTEGLSYSGSLDHGSRFADVLKRVADDEDYFRHPYISDVIPRWVTYFLGPNRSRCVNFADGAYPTPFVTTLKLLSNNYENALAGWLLAQFGARDEESFEGIVYGKPDRPAAPPPDDWPRSAVFEDIGWAALRTGWKDDDILLAFKCSSSQEGHDHTDQGNFVVNIAGTWIATDPGYGSFRTRAEGIYSRGTAGHNTILVDRAAQTARAGRITAFQTSDALDYVVGDASKCYDPNTLSRFVRHVAFVKPDYLVIWDDLESDGVPRTFQWLLHTDEAGWFEVDGQACQPGFSAPARNLRVRKERAAFTAHVLTPDSPTLTYDFWPETEANYPAFVSLEAPAAARQSYVVAFVLESDVGPLLVNPGFEQGVAGWTFGGEPGSQVQASVDESAARSGARSVRLTGEDPKRDRHLYGQWYLPAVGGALYRASIWCKTEALREGQPVVDLTFHDAERNYLPPAAYAGRGQNGTHDWEQIVVEGRAPEEARLMTFRAGLAWAGGTLWFDDAELVLVDPQPVPRERADWAFRVEGNPRDGAFAVIAERGDRQDTLILNPTGQPATVAGHTTAEPVALSRR